MTQAARLAVLLELLAERGTLSNAEIASELSISEPTVRRYLAILESRRLLARTHGGAVARGSGLEWSLQTRSRRNVDAKQKIAHATAAIVGDRDTIAINGGTTTAAVSRVLGNHRPPGAAPTMLVTTAVNIAYELAPRPEFSVLLTGGSVRTTSLEMIGPIAEATLAGISVDTAILGVDGIDARMGVTTALDMEASTSRAMMRRAHRTIIVADSTKIGRAAFALICDLSQIDALVTDAPLPTELADGFAHAGIDVIVADR